MRAMNDPAPDLFLTYRPALPLGQFVAQLWYWQGKVPEHSKDRLMPNGSGALIVNLEEDEVLNYGGRHDDVVERFPGAVLAGAHSRYSVIDTREQHAVLGVSFHPGGMWPFFDPAADELHNQHIGLGDLWGSAGATLRERILDAPTPATRLRAMELELYARAVRPLTRRPELAFAVARLARPPHDKSIAMISEHVGLSARRFARLFSLEVGMTPKRYSRIKRFESVLRLMRPAARIEWSELALNCGYFDQSHLIHDCRAISGFTPVELQSRGCNGLHVPL